MNSSTIDCSPLQMTNLATFSTKTKQFDEKKKNVTTMVRMVGLFGLAKPSGGTLRAKMAGISFRLVTPDSHYLGTAKA